METALLAASEAGGKRLTFTRTDIIKNCMLAHVHANMHLASARMTAEAKGIAAPEASAAELRMVTALRRYKAEMPDDADMARFEGLAAAYASV